MSEWSEERKSLSDSLRNYEIERFSLYRSDRSERFERFSLWSERFSLYRSDQSEIRSNRSNRSAIFAHRSDRSERFERFSLGGQSDLSDFRSGGQSYRSDQSEIR